MASDSSKQGLAPNRSYLRIGDGSRVQLWTDSWLDTRPLQELLVNSTLSLPSDFRVAQVMEPNGQWSCDILEALVPPDIIEKIRGILRPIALNIEDELYWSATPDGKFTVKSAYQQLHGGPRVSNPGEWDWIWRVP